MKNDYYFQTIAKPHPAIVFAGTINFREDSFMGLNVGDKVKAIGNTEFRGGMAALNRLDEFVTFVTYVGKFNEKGTKGEDLELLMFLVPEEESQCSEPCYLGYIILEHKEEGITELNVPDIGTNTFRIYQPKFKLYENK